MAVGWTNIFMHLVLFPAVPVPGEGWATGFNGGIELIDFKFGFEAEIVEQKSMGEHAKAILGIGKEMSFDVKPLTITKRFDISSTPIMYAIDNDLPIITATISVIGMMHTGRPMHEPGLVIVLTNGRFLDITTKIAEEGKGAQVIDTVRMSFTGMVMTYMKDTLTGKDSVTRIPTQPFLYKK